MNPFAEALLLARIERLERALIAVAEEVNYTATRAGDPQAAYFGRDFGPDLEAIRADHRDEPTP